MDFAPSDLLTIGLLVLLEGLLSADNALVLAILVLALPRSEQKKALRYGIIGAFVFRALATLFAALLQEFAETTPANVEEGKHSISLIFNDRNDDMRLVGELQPLRENDVPQDSFEQTALARAMQGADTTALQKVEGKWFYRRSVAISNFHPACSMCHANFGSVNPSQWVGALMLRVPVDVD